MKSLNNFVETHWVFNKEYSKKFRFSMVPTLQGLGLPTPIYGKKAPFGYVKEGDVFMPIEQDLQILHTAIKMCESPDYFQDDAIDWFNSAPISKTLSRRAFMYIKAQRPPFPEIELPVEKRIELLNGTTSPTSQEDDA